MMKRTILFCFVLLAGISSLTWAAAGQQQAAPAAPPTAMTLWSAAAEDEAEALVKAFNAHYPGIKVSTIRAGSGELITRLNAEQPRPQGDILLGIAKETYDGNYNLFRPYKSVNHAAIPENVRDKANPPKYYGFSMPLQAFIVNTKLLAANQYPQTWKDLADPKYRKKIIFANPALSGSAYAQIYMIWKLYGDTVLKAVAENGVFVASSTAVPESVARGEYEIGVTGEGNVADHIRRGDPVTYVYPKDGTGARFDASGIINNGPNPKAAELFMDFLTTKEAYNIILKTRSRRVVIPELPGPGPLPALSEIKLTDYDAEEAAKLRDGLIERFSNWIK